MKRHTRIAVAVKLIEAVTLTAVIFAAVWIGAAWYAFQTARRTAAS